MPLSDAAAGQARRLIDAADGDILGLRIGIKTAGCSGLQYDVQYATEVKPFEDKVEEKGVTLFIDPSAVMFLIGSKWTGKRRSSHRASCSTTPTKPRAAAVVKASPSRRRTDTERRSAGSTSGRSPLDLLHGKI